MVRQACFGTGYPVFPPFYGFLSPDPVWGEVSGKPQSPQVSAIVVDQPTSHDTTRAAPCPAFANCGSDETNGTFTVFVKLTMCAARL